MSQPFERDGTWWHKREDGVWLRWNSFANLWEPTETGPPAFLPPSPSSGAESQVSNAAVPDAPVTPTTGTERAETDGAAKQEVVRLPPRQDVIPESAAPSGLTFDLSGWIRNPVLLTLIGGMVVAAVSFVALRSFASGDQGPIPPSGASDVSKGRDAKDAFIEKADALCRQALVKMKNLPPATNAQQATRYVARTIAINQRLMTRIRDLKFPSEDRHLLKRMLNTADEMIQAASGS
jgi:hypothetical protein